MAELKSYINEAHEYASNKKFYGLNAKKAIHSKLIDEISELETALDGDLFSGMEKFLGTITTSIEDAKNLFEDTVKNSFGDELADIILVCLAGSKELGIDIEKHIRLKIEYNLIR